MAEELPKTFQMRFDLSNEGDVKIAEFLQKYPWSKTQKVKEVLLMYIEGQLVPPTNSNLAKVGTVKDLVDHIE